MTTENILAFIGGCFILAGLGLLINAPNRPQLYRACVFSIAFGVMVFISAIFLAVSK